MDILELPSRRFPSAIGPLALGFAVLVALGAGLFGSSGPREIVLDLGPGDGPFTSGFARPRPDSFDPYEVQDGTATHWTTHEARIALPIVVDTETLGVRLRFARHLADRGHVDVRLGGQPLARFAIGGGYVNYDAALTRAGEVRLVLDLAVDAKDDRGLGISLDRVVFSLEDKGHLRLSGLAAGRLPLTVLLVAGVLMLAGARTRTTSAFAIVVAALGAASLLTDPWLAYRLLRGVPETLALLAVPVVAAGRLLSLRATGAGSPATATAGARSLLPMAAGLLLGGFLLRAALLNHPAFYNPDYRMHAGLIEVARKAGLDLVRSPSSWLFTPRQNQTPGDPLRRATSGLWIRRVGGRDVGLPYSLLPHFLLSVLPLDHDGRLAALRLVGAFFAAVPAALGVFLCGRLGLSPWTAVLVAAAPAGGAELALGGVPAVIGHAADVGVVLLVAFVPPLGARRVAGLSLAVATAQLVYVSSTLLVPTFLVALAVLVSRFEPGGRPRARGLLLALAAGSLASLLVYYRDFVPDALATMRALAHASGPLALADPGRDRVFSALRDWGFATVPLLAAGGLVLAAATAGRSGASAPWILPAWTATVVALGTWRWAFPSALGFVHLPLFAAPLLALGAGGALEALWRRGRLWASLAGAAGLFIVAHGFWLQWLAVRAERLGS